MNMTLYTNTYGETRSYTPEELLRLRREKVRDRRLKEGSLLSGHILGTRADNLIELYPAALRRAQ